MDQIRNKDGLTEREFLDAYTPGDYEKPSVTTDVLLFTVDDKPSTNPKKTSEKVLKILMIRRKDHPFMGKWALPGGFVDMDEGITSGAYRELHEETSIIDDVYLEQLYTVGDKVNRDPRMRVISTAYMALTPNTNIKKTIAGDDAQDAKWFEISLEKVLRSDDKLKTTYLLKFTNDELGEEIMYILAKENKLSSNGKTFTTTNYWLPEISKNVLAFDHVEIIEKALERLKNKVEYTPIAFTLLPDEFTLNELQSLYELLLNKPLTAQNFRKKMVPMLVKTGNVKTDVQHRPANYYKYNPMWELEMED